MPPIRSVIAGCGAKSRRWLDTLGDALDLEILGLADRNAAAAQTAAAACGLSDAAIGCDLAAMLERTKPDVLFDVVLP